MDVPQVRFYHFSMCTNQTHPHSKQLHYDECCYFNEKANYLVYSMFFLELLMAC